MILLPTANPATVSVSSRVSDFAAAAVSVAMGAVRATAGLCAGLGAADLPVSGAPGLCDSGGAFPPSGRGFCTCVLVDVDNAADPCGWRLRSDVAEVGRTDFRASVGDE